VWAERTRSWRVPRKLAGIGGPVRGRPQASGSHLPGPDHLGTPDVGGDVHPLRLAQGVIPRPAVDQDKMTAGDGGQVTTPESRDGGATNW
jgi:hypothetical protein